MKVPELAEARSFNISPGIYSVSILRYKNYIAMNH